MDAHTKLLTAETNITSFSLYAPESMFAYCEKGNTNVKIVKWSPNSGLVTQMASLSASSDVSIVSLSFSSDGRHLAALGGIPTHTISVWDWKSQKLLSSSQNGHAATKISFNPVDPYLLCTSGDDGCINFWRLKIEFKRHRLICTNGVVALPLSQEENTAKNPEPKTQNWVSESVLMSVSSNGKELYEFDVYSGIGKVVETPVTERMTFCLGNKLGLYIACVDGSLTFVPRDGQPNTEMVSPGRPIINIVPSADYHDMLLETNDRILRLIDTDGKKDTIVMTNLLMPMTAISQMILSNMVVGTSKEGEIVFWEADKSAVSYFGRTGTEISSISVCPTLFLLAVGSPHGVIRFYDFSNFEAGLRLVYRERIHQECMTRLAFDPTGMYLASASQDGYLMLYLIDNGIKPIGYLFITGTIVKLAWTWQGDGTENSPKTVRLYVLAQSEAKKSSQLYRFEFSGDGNIPVSSISQQIDKTAISSVSYKLEDLYYDFCIAPEHLSNGRETFYISSKHALRVFVAPSVQQQADKVTLSNALFEFKDHDNTTPNLSLSHNGEWLLSWATNGTITVRSLLEPEKAVKAYSHDVANDGVSSACFSRDCRTIFTLGGGLFRRFDWKYSANGRRNAMENTEHMEQVANEALEEALVVAKSLNETENLSDAPFELCFIKSVNQTQNVGQTKSNEQEQQQIIEKVQSITQRLLKLMEQNQNAPPLERIDREEFIIDFQKRDQLIAQVDQAVNEIRKKSQESNMTQRVIRNRIMNECWDSMECVGQAVKSFKPYPLTNKPIVLQNYPIRKRSQKEQDMIQKVKFLRSVECQIERAFQHTEDQKEDKPSDTDATSLLYTPSEITTNHRRRTQIVILTECIEDVKRKFNEKFKEVSRTKQDEIAKIEDKNERISTILKELGIQEEVWHPELDREEMPESIITVKDSEVKVERFLSAEDKKKEETKRRIELERQKAQAEDNARQRALMMMMNGKLDDKKEQAEEVDLTRPEWMNKPKEEMTDDEKKLVKEFEKKLAVYKEEQEKARKALETELRKLQSVITEICEQFDTNLLEAFKVKINTDNQIYQIELKIAKMNQSLVTGEDDEERERELLQKQEKLKSEKQSYASEIPEIKKELERCREDYESAVKADKEIEKQFKKDFHVYEFYFDALTRLFKRRHPEKMDKQGEIESLSPFDAEKQDALEEIVPPKLVAKQDMPEGIGIDVWNKLVEIRDRKIEAEIRLFTTSRRFQQLQNLVQNLLEDSERLRGEIDRVNSDLEEFAEYKFQSMYNVESLFQLKQGQVEVPQQPIVTDYSDAILIHRQIVESLNEEVLQLGQAKVDALTEMKDYRKGIHSLEWENQMLDFQAEDLVIKTRDIQLLRVTKQMQEFIRSGDEHKQAAEVASLEKNAEYATKAHEHRLQEKRQQIEKLKALIRSKKQENSKLDQQLLGLESQVNERTNLQQMTEKKHTPTKTGALKDLFNRRRLADLAKSQAQDIAILREEVERLRLRTYPAFHS
ncbi:WD40-repeat-containing domain protein [Gorgonomyces haynaldii]|nr:WD40-repeat-containing domain protein [Gorgonomyces haynaldii]